MPSEAYIQKEIRLALSQYGKAFRTNAGKFWQGKPVFSKEFGQNILINLRPIEGLPQGFSDLLFVGENRVAFIETKKLGEKPRLEQGDFLELMQSMGHYAGVARSPEDALRIIQGTTGLVWG